MKATKEMLVLVATMATPEMLIERIKTSCESYETAALIGDEEQKKEKIGELLMGCHLIILNQQTEGKVENMDKVLSAMNKLEQREKLFTTENN